MFFCTVKLLLFYGKSLCRESCSFLLLLSKGRGTNSLLATIWVLRYHHLHLESHTLWKKLVQFGKGMERNRRMFEDYIGTGVEELWERVTFWSALWASVLLPFKDCFSYILLLEGSEV